MSIAQDLLHDNIATLEKHTHTKSRFIADIFYGAVAVTIIWAGIIIIPLMIWNNAVHWIIPKIIAACIYLGITLDSWRSIGERSVTIDISLRTLIIKEHFPNRKNGTQTRKTPFNCLLFFRYWRAESDNESAAFIIKLAESKNIYRPDLTGYILHIEPAHSQAEQADVASNLLADQFHTQTEIEYLDIQKSKNPKYALWTNAMLSN
ncbi:hypothetical protein [Iodobacter fluviatilis]|uniref:Uncharacterized protein n=1 Tax=Iodobacter fluviatilis TaxID=537 RepID=A0A377SYL4_9NEIS|nr:hypothetical protein [Iodobacter fluviatilis]TCU81933.1 hypothetical protein EV682_11854 [Iodobacter fluviatilis]STQ91534.1 Uncharacterised protein [Iodobacter fluviatilis]STR46057.1 Uncharacterised protein [Iodobacter fluviatilis]